MATFVCEGVGASRQCEFCGELFRSDRATKRFCNRSCKIRAGSVRRTSLECTCSFCGKFFSPKKSDRTKFCSRECSFGNKAKNAAERKPTLKPKRPCVRCNETLIASNKHYCTGCLQAYTPVPRTRSVCIECGAPIMGTAAKRKCKRCVRKRSHRMRKHRQRARHFGVSYEPINVVAVFDRDSWRCQVCGVRTPKSKRGTFADNAPELDHRVPMSRGGSHTWENVQCCCRSCNIAKGAGLIVGQLNMFPVAS